MKKIDVAVGVVYRETDPQKGVFANTNAHRHFFICRRNAQQHQGDKWEFPGGKVNANESPVKALKRELKEEIDITVNHCEPLLNINFDYPDKSVCLHVFLVSNFNGEAKGAEGQQSLWVNANELSSYTFPDANAAILDALRTKDFI